MNRLWEFLTVAPPLVSRRDVMKRVRGRFLWVTVLYLAIALALQAAGKPGLMHSWLLWFALVLPVVGGITDWLRVVRRRNVGAELASPLGNDGRASMWRHLLIVACCLIAVGGWSLHLLASPQWKQKEWGLFASMCVFSIIGLANAYSARVENARQQAQQRRRSGLCVACGYNLTGNVSGVCPECGTAIPPTRIEVRGVAHAHTPRQI